MLRMKTVKQLNGRRREEVRALEQLCCAHDGLTGGLIFSAEDEKPLFFLCYDEELLAGVAILYSMGDSSEISCFIHPEYRGRATTKKIYVALCREIALRGTKKNYLVVEPHPSALLHQIVKENIFQYDYSEYLMEWKYSYLLQNSGMLQVRTVAQEDEPAAAALLAGAFEKSQEEMAARVGNAGQENCVYYGAWRKNTLLGVFAVLVGKESIYVYDFAVDADNRKRGYGKELIKGLIYTMQQEHGTQKTIRIQVGSKNEEAFRLYQKNGFQVLAQRDYYLLTEMA